MTRLKTRPKKRLANPGFMNTPKEEKKTYHINALGTEIHQMWHKFDGTLIPDLESYLLHFFADNKEQFNIAIAIGTDGLIKPQGKGRNELRMLSVISLHKIDKAGIGKGCHVIGRREHQVFDRYIETPEKLNLEVNKTYEVAMYLDSINIRPDIHLDLNPNESYESFNVYNSIKGFFESLGFNAEYKPNSPAASFAADYFL